MQKPHQTEIWTVLPQAPKYPVHIAIACEQSAPEPTGGAYSLMAGIVYPQFPTTDLLKYLAGQALQRSGTRARPEGMSEKNLILASKSPFRAMLMKNAGLAFTQAAADVDERAIETAIAGSGLSPEDLALVLAEAKAQDVSNANPQALVLGSDQTLSLGDEVLHKAENMDEAAQRLTKLSGKTHQLNSAVVLARNGETIWRNVSIARLTMRTLTPQFIGRHLARTGKTVLGSVGCYQLEGEGLQLFDQIEGDYFTIVGLPMLPLLAKLRELGAIDG